MSLDLDTKLRDKGKVSPSKFFRVNSVVYVDGFAAPITSQGLNELSIHSSSSQMCSEPVPETVRRKMVFRPTRLRIMQAYSFCVFQHHRIDSVPFEPVSLLADENGRDYRIELGTLAQPPFQKTGCFIVEENGSIAAFLELFSFQRDRLLSPAYVVNIHADQFTSSHTCLCQKCHYRLVSGV